MTCSSLSGLNEGVLGVSRRAVGRKEASEANIAKDKAEPMSPSCLFGGLGAISRITYTSECTKSDTLGITLDVSMSVYGWGHPPCLDAFCTTVNVRAVVILLVAFHSLFDVSSILEQSKCLLSHIVTDSTEHHGEIRSDREKMDSMDIQYFQHFSHSFTRV